MGSSDRTRHRAAALALSALIAVLLAAAADTLHHNYILTPLLRPGLLANSVRGGAALLFLALAWILITRSLALRLAAFSHRARLGWLSASAAAGALAIVVVPLAGLRPTLEWHVQVTATGRMNPAAKSSEVWLTGVTAGRESVAIEELAAQGSWTRKDGSLFSVPPQPATLAWSGIRPGPLELTFAAHPWCGVVEVSVNNQRIEADLFSETSTHRTLRFSAEGSVNVISSICFRLAQWLLGAVLFLTCGLLLAQRGSGQMPPQPGRGAFWLYGGACVAVWSVYLAAFWPAALSPDSVAQWMQATGQASLSNNHPFTHTLINRAITSLWRSPAAIALAQIIALAAAVGWGMASLRRAGTPRWAAALFTSLIALSTASSTIVVTLWKDVPYAVALLAPTILLFNIVLSGGSILRKPHVAIGLGVCAALLPLLRHEAVLTAACTLLLVLTAFRQRWRAVLCSVGLAAAIYLGMTTGVKRVLHVEKAMIGIEYLMVHHVAAHWAAGTPFAPEERELVALLHTPGEDLVYTPYTARTVLPGFKRNALGRRAEFRQLFWATLRRAPGVNLRHLYHASGFVWRLRVPADSIYLTVPIWREEGKLRYIVDNEAGLTEQSLAPALASSLVDAWGYASSGVFQWLVWRVPLWFYLGLGGVILAAIRLRDPRLLLVAAPILLHSMTAALLPISNSFRYVFGVYVTSLVLASLLFVARRTADTRK